MNNSEAIFPFRKQYDFIVCGAGASGSVVARRLAENPNVSVLLLEAGGSDDTPAVLDPKQWVTNLGTERDWSFKAEPNEALHGRAIPLSMGKVLGGGSSINSLIWSRGHRTDWDFFAEEAGDPAWNYRSALQLYHRIEHWHGSPDARYRGTGGPIFVQPSPNPSALVPAILEAAGALGIPTFESQNGAMMESPGGCSVSDVILNNGKRQSVYRSYVAPILDGANITVVTGALVTRIAFEGKRATAIEVVCEGEILRVGAVHEIILSLGAIQTPKLLMQSGVGEEKHLREFGIPLVEHLPGVGQNLEDHPGFGCVWKARTIPEGSHPFGEAVFFWKSDSGLPEPDMIAFPFQGPLGNPELLEKYQAPPAAWSMFAGVLRPKSRGQIRLTGAAAEDPVRIDGNHLQHPDDVSAAVAIVRLCRELANSVGLRSFIEREIMPGDLRGAALETFVRDAAVTYWHQSCTAKMGRDSMAVVDSKLRVYGIDGLRIADASIMPRVTTGNTMAPCVLIGERAGDMLKTDHGI